MIDRKKLSKNGYRYAEKVMYRYLENCEKHKLYEERLEYLEDHGDVQVQDYRAERSVGKGTDRVLDYVHEKQQLEKRLKRLEVEIGVVEGVQRRLKSEVGGSNRQGIKLLVLEKLYIRQEAKVISYLSEEELSELRHELVREVQRGLSSIKVL